MILVENESIMILDFHVGGGHITHLDGITSRDAKVREC